ncbi:MAG: PEGA domain-containing protein [Betaproteobacteria bacterium]|nr:PEGA domain-containing protein [Betaproteobacteria bacterium]
MDFGSARHVQEDKTAPSTIFLKPGFASVEQYSETDTMKVGPWTDIYAISALAYLVVTGKMPIISVARVVKDQLVPLSAFASAELPARLLKVIEAGLSVEPWLRPQSVEAFIAALEREAMKGALKPPVPGPRAGTEERRSLARSFLARVVDGMTATRARLPKLRDILAPIRAGLVRIRGWGTALHKAMFAALAAMRTRLPKLRDVLAPIRAGLVKMRGWGIALRKAMFTALAAMRAGLLRMFARLASMLAGLAKSIAKMLGKTGTGIKAGTDWLLDVVVSAASKTRNAAASAMSAFQNRCGKLSKKAFSGTGRKTWWGVIGAALLLVVVLPSLFFFFFEGKVSAEMKTVRLALPEPVVVNTEPEPAYPPPPSLPDPSPEPPPPPREPLPSDVQVTIAVKPWGDIYIDGVKIGTAPPTLNIKASRIKEGPHKIEIRNESGRTYTQNIMVTRGQHISLTHVFK